MTVTPTKWGRGRKGFSHAEGMHNKFEVVLTRELEVLAIVMGGGVQEVSSF